MHHCLPLRLLGLAGLGACFALPTLAQEGGYGYGGLSAGRSKANLDAGRMAAEVLGPGLATTAVDRDERGSAYRVFGGYQLNRNLGVELGVFDLGRFGFDATTAPPGTLGARMRVRGVDLDLVGTLPMTERLSALLRVGVARSRTRDSFEGSGAAVVTDPSVSRNSTGPKLGAGLQYEFTPSFLVRGEATRYRVSDGVRGKSNVDLLSVSLVFPFGRSAQTAPRVAQAMPAPMPMPMAMAMAAPPPPAPLPPVVEAPVVAPAAPPVLRRVTYSAQSLFGFDRSELQPQGRSALDGFVRELDGSSFSIVVVEGHTDRLGTPAYNQTLSVQRADAVKAYLVGAGRLDSAKVSASGKGETTPLTVAGDCTGSAPTAKLIACLQPDRRVELEVVGTR